MSAAATAAGYLYASGRLRRKDPPKCEKTSYQTESSALSNAVYRMSQGSPPLRVYICPACNAYHLSSKEPRL